MTSNENINKTLPKITKAAEGTRYRGLIFPYLCQPAIKREIPAKIEKNGHKSDNGKGIICKDDRKRKNPNWRKNAAMKKYKDLLFNFTAITAKTAPIITTRNEMSTEILDVPEIVPRREAIPKSMSKSPIKNDNFAAIFRSDLVCIQTNYNHTMISLPIGRGCDRMQP